MLQNATFLLLASNPVLVGIIGGVVGLAVGAVVFYVISNVVRKNKLDSTERLVAEMKANAENECRAIKKDAIVKIKEQELNLRTEFEKETRVEMGN